MKKFYLSLLSLVSCFAIVRTEAQVASYNFAQSMGTYTPITGGTLLAAQTVTTGTAAGALDDVVYTTPLPFNFTYSGVAYTAGTNINVSTNGFISFGTAPGAGNYTPISGADNNTIAAFGIDCNGGWAASGTTTTGSPEITAIANTSGFVVGALVSGTGVPTGATVVSINPNVSITISANCTSSGTGRTISCATGEIRAEQVGNDYVIQFKNMRRYNVALSRVNAQIRLTQTTNVVSIVYGDWFAAASNTPQVGLRGASAADYNNRTTTTNWAASTAGASNTATMTWSASVLPASGLTYTWTQASCITPFALTLLSFTTSSANIGWTPPTPAPANGYEYILSTTNTPPAGGGTPFAGTSINLPGLPPNTNHYFWVRSACASDFSNWVGPLQFRTGYCLPSSTAPDTYINNFSTTSGSVNISNLGTGYTTNGYADYYATQNATITAASSLSFNLELVGGTVGAAIWVDFNNNLVFESTERLYNTTAYTSGPIANSITIPAGTTPGEYRMRVLIHYNANNPADPCASNARLEAEDYKLTVLAQPTDAMDWVNLQWPSTASVPAGGTGVTVYTRGYEPGVTETAGPGAGISAWIGISPIGAAASSDPATWTNWVPATFNVQVGNDDEFSAVIGSTLAVGTYQYASRWQLNNGPFRYGGFNAGGGGFWDGVNNVSGVLTVTAPAGDDACDAITLTVDNPTATCVNTTPYTAVGDPGISSCSAANNTVWFKFTPTTTGIHTITASVPGSSGNGLSGWLFLYTAAGTCPGTLTFTTAGGISCTAGPAAGTAGTVTSVNTTTVLDAGTTYYLLVDGNSGDVGDVCIQVTRPLCPAPTAAAATSITQSTANANWTPTTGNFIIEYGPTASFTPVGTGATAGNANNFIVTASNVGTIQLTGLNSATGYSYVVRLDCSGSGNGFSANTATRTFTTLAPAPANDDCANALTLTVNPDLNCSSVTAGTVNGATGTADATCTGSEDDDVWFKFTATATSHVVSLLNIAGSVTDMAFQVLDACGGTSLLCSDPNSGTVSGLTIGNTYIIRVYTYTTTGGQNTTFNVCVGTQPAPPANDNCAGAIAISGTATAGTNAGSTESLPANALCTSTSSPDVWYTFTATSNGSAIIALTGVVTIDPILEAFTGTCGALTSLGCVDAGAAGANETQTLNGLTAGQTIYVRVTGWNGGFGTFNIAVTGGALPVSIEYFTGTKQNGQNRLDWKVNCYNSATVTMTLQRSADGRNYSDLVTLTETAVRCQSPFNQNDANPVSGINYYRLKTADIDGRVTYSNVVVLLNQTKGFALVSLAPNPVADKAVLSITSAEKSIMEIVVTDVNGKQISKQRVSLIAGNNQVQLNLRNVAAGTYQVSGLTADGAVKTLRFVKE